MQSLIIHGRQPELGRAELESLYGPSKLQPIGAKATLVDVDPCLLAFDRLGGALKFCKVLTELDTNNWKTIEKFLIEVAPGHSQRMPEGKMNLGLSIIGLDVSPKQVNATALTIKKAIKRTGRNVRVIPNNSLELNTAQVLHNNLTGQTGWELIFIYDKNRTIVAQTVKVQDIEAYARRDQNRPKRDTRVGMLPPKLAQIIINLAVGGLPDEAKQSICDIPPDQPIPGTHFDQTILDPFCGTGVLLQEALLMGYDTYGSDIDKRMVDYSRANLEWLSKIYPGLKGSFALEVADATAYKWQGDFQFIACETYLGRPLTSLPSSEILNKIIQDCDTIHKKFLQNIAKQTKKSLRLCLAVPAWKTKNGFKHLPTLDKLTDLGYNRVKFVHASDNELIYHRPNQTVARELVVLERN